MAVRFVLGKAGSGKTRHCIDGVLGALAAPGDHRLVLLTPEQATYQMERALVERVPGHGYTRAAVLSFTRLADQALDETGGAPELLSPFGRELALRALARQEPELLRAFGAAGRTSGFFVELSALLEEIMADGLTAGALAETVQRLAESGGRRRAEAVAAVYARYLEWLGPDRIDASQRLDVARARLERLEWLPQARIWVDGFARLGGQERMLLVELCRRAADVTITLLLDPASSAAATFARRRSRTGAARPDPLNLFATTETTYRALLAALADAGVTVEPPVLLTAAPPPRFTAAPDLVRLEADLARPLGSHGLDADAGMPTPAAKECHHSHDSTSTHVRILECRTHREELRQAARFIRQSVIDSGGALRFRDFAVAGRDLRPIARLVADVFDEYDVPFFLDQRRPLGAHALCRFLAALLETVRTGFGTGAAVSLLRTGLAPLERREAEWLENRIVEEEIAGWEAWLGERAWFGGRFSRTGLDDQRRRLAAALRPLRELAARDEAAGAAWAHAVYDCLAALGVDRRIRAWIVQAQREGEQETAELHRMAWDTLCDALDELSQLLGETEISFGAARDVLVGALRDVTVGLTPPTLDQVLVGSIERSRHPDIRHLWLLGFNEGVFPAPPAAERLLSGEDREALREVGLDGLRPRRDDAFAERLLAYIACTRPSAGLVISFASVSEGGEPLLPSPLLGDIQRALPGLEVERPADDEPPSTLYEAAAGWIAAVQPARSAGDAGASQDIARGARRYLFLDRELRGDAAFRTAWLALLRGRDYANQPGPVGNFRRPEGMTGVAWLTSASETEQYLACPYQHFASRGLKLSAERGAPPMAIEIGVVAHEVLAKVVTDALAGKTSIPKIVDKQWRKLLRDAIAAVRAERDAEALGAAPARAFLLDSLEAFLDELVLVLAERWRRGKFQPVCAERLFGPATGVREEAEHGDNIEPLPAVRLELDEKQCVLVRGRIDRIDECKDKAGRRLLVYDYKSTVGATRRSFLTGDLLELFVYLLAVDGDEAGKKKTTVAGALFMPLFPDESALDKGHVAEADAAEQRLFMYRPRGVLDRDVARSLDPTLGESPSPMAAMRLKKDGDFNKAQSRDVVNAETLARFTDLARRTLLHAAEGVCKGSIDIEPLRIGRTLACNSCSYRPLCRFEHAYNRVRAAEKRLPVLEVPVVEEEEEGGGDK